MATHPDEQTVLSFMQSSETRSIAQMDGVWWSAWHLWLLDKPWFAQSLHDGLMAQGFQAVECEQAMSAWLKQSFPGPSAVSAGTIDASDGLTCWQVQATHQATGEPMVCQIDVRHAHPKNMPAPSARRCIDALWELESRLLICHPHAPVLVANHHPQSDSDDLRCLGMGFETSSHLAVESFAYASPNDRKRMMEQDNESSDLLAQDKMASEQARKHQGPFYYTTALCPPAPALVAMRSSIAMADTPSPALAEPKAAPRL